MKRIKWVLFIILILMFGVLAHLVMQNKTGNFDDFVYNIIVADKNEFLIGFYKFITMFASEFIILMISLVTFLILKNKRYGLYLISEAFLFFFLNISLKLIFLRERPLDLMIIVEDGFSFPSGHAMVALGFYGLFIYFIWQMNLSKPFKVIVSVLLVLFILLIGASRIFLGVHYASDVLAGFIVSGAFLILYISFIRKKEV